MKKWKIAFFTTLFVLVASNLFWLYTSFDQAISYSYLHDSLDGANSSKAELGKLLVQGSKLQKYTQSDILHFLRQSNPDAFIVQEGNTIITEHVKFTFTNGKLSNVQ